jgi:hypothetical protein
VVTDQFDLILMTPLVTKEHRRWRGILNLLIFYYIH